MKLQQAASLEQELETLRALNGGKVDAEMEEEYAIRIETLRNEAAQVYFQNRFCTLL
jgi:hypothetical protein